ncbi:MAG: hypothetical protein EOM87_08335, partial [Clostridia bacterium]|nr:hypothetical protein [Clostridia bacterium]
FELYPLKAPVEKNQKVGVAYALKNNQVVFTTDLLALEGTEKANFGIIFERTLGKWGIRS